MKILLVLLCTVGLSYAEKTLAIPKHLRAPLRVLHRACQSETDVEEQYITMSRNGYVLDDPKLKCYILCLFEHSGMIEDDGTIHWDDVMHLLSPEVAEAALHVSEVCMTKHGDTRCETAYLTTKCYFEELPEGSEIP